MTGYESSFDGTPKRERSPVPTAVSATTGRRDTSATPASRFAVYFADWYPHQNAAWAEAILGSFAEREYADDVTIGSRYGYIDGQADAAASHRLSAAAPALGPVRLRLAYGREHP